MIIGISKEIKDNEYSVSVTPGGVHLLVHAGHRVLVEQGAGKGSGFTDRDGAEARSGSPSDTTAAGAPALEAT